MAYVIEQINVGNATYDIASTAYAVCSSDADQATKIISGSYLNGLVATPGVTIHVKFANANTADNPKLNISNGDTTLNNAIPIVGITEWPAGTVLTLTYDGTSWIRDYVEGEVANNITGSGTSGSLAKFNGTNTITDGPAFTTSYDASTAVTTAHKFLREDGTWVVPKYTTDTNSKVTVYLGNNNSTELPIGGLNTAGSTPSYASHTSSTKSAYAAIPTTVANRPTINLGSGAITAPGGIVGNASTATGFASAKTIALTGNVTGSATGGNSTNGWSIATTIGEGVVTNAMLAGSITNAKLVNDWIKIGNVTKHLGETFTLSDLGIAAAMNFKGTTTTNLSTGDTTSPITVGGADYTPVNGDVVLNSGKEFVWTGTAWEELGDESSWALSSDVLHISGAKGDIIYWSNTNSPTHLTAGSDGAVLKLSNGVPIWGTDNDTKVTQAYSIANKSYPLLFSNIDEITSTDSRGATTALVNNTIYVNPSTGTINATEFVGGGSGLTDVSVDWSNVNNKVLANLYVNATSGGSTSDAAVSSGSTYIHLYDNNTKQATISLTGAGGTTITTTNGKAITITSKTYTEKTAVSVLNSLKLKYTDTTTTPDATSHDDAVSSDTATPTALGVVNNAVLFIKSLYYGTTSVSPGINEI